MAGMTVTVEGIEGLTSLLSRLGDLDLTPVVTAVTQKGAQAVRAAAPSDTGELRRSVSAKSSGGEGYVRVGAEYAPHVEYGHRQNVGQVVFIKSIPGFRRLVRPYVEGTRFFEQGTGGMAEDLQQSARRYVERVIGGMS